METFLELVGLIAIVTVVTIAIRWGRARDLPITDDEFNNYR